jgi:uncharacterized RDD family membrane protein YckC
MPISAHDDVSSNDDGLNPYAAPMAEITTSDEAVSASALSSHFWRFAAFFVDYWLFVGLWIAVGCVLQVVRGDELPSPFGQGRPDLVLGRGPTALAAILFWTAYFGLQESSHARATVGKRLVRLRVKNLRGERLSVIRASLRAVLKLVGLAAFGLGLIPALFTQKRQALHDLVMGTVVVRVPEKLQ